MDKRGSQTDSDRLHLSPRHREELEGLLRTHLPEVEVWAYGSRVTGRSHDGSDLDLALRGPDLRRIEAGPLVDLWEALRDSTLPFLVEARDWARLPESFHREIEREYVVLVRKPEQDRLAGGWCEGCWGDLVSLEYGRSLRGHDTNTGQFRVFGTNGPIGWHDKALCPYPSVVIGRKGAYRGVHYSSRPFYVIDTAFYLKPKTEIDVRWAYYELRTKDIDSMDSGSAIPSTSREEFYSLPVRIPPLPEQRAIAHILGTLDDKIETNRHMNETLEAMAQAIFKDWFVDFGPTRAKAEGHEPYLPESLWSLFPDRFVDSELGEIPEGWTVGSLADVAEHIRDQEKPFASPNTLYHHFSIPAFDKDRQPKIECGENIKSQKFRVPPDAILLSRLNPEIERVWLADINAKDRAVCSTEFLVLQSCPPYGISFPYCLGRSYRFRQAMNSLVTGTSRSHQRAPVDAVLSLPIVLSPESISDAFENIVVVYLKNTRIIRREQYTLYQIRNALLPKLVSGDIRVPGL